MNQTQLITVFGIIAAAAGAVSQIPDVTGTFKLICVVVAAVAGAACAYLAKGRKDTGSV